MSQSPSGGVRVVLRLEGFAVLTLSLVAYAHDGIGWGTFALLFLVPDLSILAYLAGPAGGAWVYNAAHSYIGPLMLSGLGIVGGGSTVIALAIIWAAHIGADRALGYGLKSATGFRFTHLGAIGRQIDPA